MAGTQGREFKNPYPDYNGETMVDENGKMTDVFDTKLRGEVQHHLSVLYSGLEQELDWHDYTVYTGTSGIALLHYHLYKTVDMCRNDRYLKQALYYVEKPLRHLKRKKLTFMCGDAGPLAIGAVLYSELGQSDHSTDCINRLLSRHQAVCEDAGLPDEMLFGRVGYLWSLLYVNRQLGEHTVPLEIIDKVYKMILASGQGLSQREGSPCPLMYAWHDKKYLGAAHGLVGIFYTLMQLCDNPAYKQYLDQLVLPTINWMMTLRFPSGNYPSSIGNQSDKLVHWCHGAPGWIHLFIMAYKTFGEERFLTEACSCADVLWHRGLLTKGYGICHGVAGNAYGFLALYRLTKDQKYLHRACKFAEWCFDYGKHGCKVADRPFSLFEGLAGTIYFLADLLQPENAKFPAFDL